MAEVNNDHFRAKTSQTIKQMLFLLTKTDSSESVTILQ